MPLHSLQDTLSAVPTPRPTPESPKRAAEAPESSQVSKLTLAPYWLVSDVVACAQSGFPSAVTMVSETLPRRSSLPELTWAQVVHLDHNTVTGVRDSVARGVGLDRQFPAAAACWACASTWAYAKHCNLVLVGSGTERSGWVFTILRDGGGIAGRGVEAASCCSGLAVGRAEAVACAILGEGGFVGLGGGGGRKGEGCKARLEEHLGCCCVVLVSDGTIRL